MTRNELVDRMISSTDYESKLPKLGFTNRRGANESAVAHFGELESSSSVWDAGMLQLIRDDWVPIESSFQSSADARCR